MSEGILIVNKPKGKTAFDLVWILRKITKVKTIGHAGTLDPMATGLMVMLIGKPYTRLSSQLISHNKEYLAEITLGFATDTFDAEGKTTHTSQKIPTLEEVKDVIESFQGTQLQTPPMFSAKKVKGKKLCDLARKGITIERKAETVHIDISLINYNYPKLELQVKCSKGTYIRSLAHDIGIKLDSFATLTALHRTHSGDFTLAKSVDGSALFTSMQASDLTPYLSI